MKNIAAYVRISQDFSGERWGVDTQRKKIKALAEARSWNIVDWYEDNDTSASKPRGPKTDWARMLEEALQGRFDTVVAVDIDRLLRTTKDLNTLIDHGLRVVTVDGEIDLSTADGEFRATMLAAIARFETRRKSERTRRSNARRRAEGIPVRSGKRAFGYSDDGLVIPQQAEAVRKAFESFLTTPALSIKRIAMDLNQAGFVTARGTAWSTDTARYLLNNPLYAGFIKHYETGELFPVKGEAFPAIVDEDTWRASADKLADNVRKTTRVGNKPKHLLSSVGRCGKCGATLVGGRNENGVPNYKCGKSFHLSRQMNLVDAMVTEAVLVRLSAPDALELMASRSQDDGIDRDALRSERTALRARADGLQVYLSDPDRPLEALLSALERIEERITQIDGELLAPSRLPGMDVMEAASRIEDEAERRAMVDEAWNALDMDRKRLIVDALVRVTIEPIKRGHWRFNPDLIRIEPQTG